MGFGMAAMFSPVGVPAPTAVWVGLFLLSCAWFAAVALRSAPGPGRAGAIHHLIGSGAMLFMLLGAHTGFGEPGAEHTGHVGHGGGPEGDLGLPSVAAIVLAAVAAGWLMPVFGVSLLAFLLLDALLDAGARRRATR